MSPPRLIDEQLQARARWLPPTAQCLILQLLPTTTTYYGQEESSQLPKIQGAAGY